VKKGEHKTATCIILHISANLCQIWTLNFNLLNPKPVLINQGSFHPTCPLVHSIC